MTFLLAKIEGRNSNDAPSLCKLRSNAGPLDLMMCRAMDRRHAMSSVNHAGDAVAAAHHNLHGVLGEALIVGGGNNAGLAPGGRACTVTDAFVPLSAGAASALRQEAVKPHGPPLT